MTVQMADWGAATSSKERAGQLRALALVAGAGLWLLAVGGRWDLPSAAWLSPILLLHFTRTGGAGSLGLIWLVSIGAAVFWAWQMAVPLQATTMAACAVFGTVYALPYLADRLIVRRGRIGEELLVFPLSVVVSEWIMGVFSPLGTAYGLKAVTQSDHLALLQVTTLTGPYAIGFLIAWLATTVHAIWQRSGDRSLSIRLGGAYVAALALVIVGGEARLAWLDPVGTPSVSMAGLSPGRSATGIAQALAHERVLGGHLPSEADKTALRAAFAVVNDELAAGTRRAAAAGAKLVQWSENGAMLLVDDEAAFLAQASALARETGIYLNVANRVYASEAPFGRDETHLFGPDGQHLWTYQKARPIPGLETYEPGDGRVPVMETPFGRIANVICYDADFPALLTVDTDIMLVPGGDWPEMGRVHTLKMARLRAIENGYALFRQDYFGLSAVFDATGRVIASQDTTGEGPHMMLADVPTVGHPTVYRSVGDVFAWSALGTLLALLALGLSRRPEVRGTPTDARAA